MKDELLTAKDVASYLGVSEATLADWRYRRRGPDYILVGRLVRYRRESLVAWLDARSIQSARGVVR